MGQLHFYACDCPVFPAPFTEETPLSPIVYIFSACHKLIEHIWICLLSGCSSMFNWSTCLFLCQYNTVLITIDIIWFEIWGYDASSCAPLSQGCFDYSGFFRIACSRFVKNATGIFDRIYLHIRICGTWNINGKRKHSV